MFQVAAKVRRVGFFKKPFDFAKPFKFSINRGLFCFSVKSDAAAVRTKLRQNFVPSFWLKRLLALLTENLNIHNAVIYANLRHWQDQKGKRAAKVLKNKKRGIVAPLKKN